MTRWGEEKEGAALAGMKLECAFLVSLLALALERVSQRPKPGPDEDVTVFFWGGTGSVDHGGVGDRQRSLKKEQSRAGEVYSELGETQLGPGADETPDATCMDQAA